MIKYILLSLTILLSYVKSNAQNNYHQENISVDSFLINSISKYKIPGLAIAVIKDGKIIKMNSYGLANVEWNAPVTKHTNFQIASSTKLLTSVLLLKTIYNKKININAPITKYIDSAPHSWNKILVKHLISHSSGIADYYNSDAYLPTKNIVQVVMKQDLLFAPGSKEQYGLSDFMVLSYIFEKIYNKPFTEILHDEVILPLNMTDGAFDMEFRVDNKYMRTNLITQKATTYFDFNGKLTAYKYLYPQYTYSAGGYFASINDMANWAIGLDKQSLFSTQLANKYIYARDSIAGKLAGFSQVGWVVDEENGIAFAGHSGGPGLGDILRYPKYGYTFIALSNDGELLPSFARAIASFYIKELPQKFTIEKFDR